MELSGMRRLHVQLSSSSPWSEQVRLLRLLYRRKVIAPRENDLPKVMQPVKNSIASSVMLFSSTTEPLPQEVGRKGVRPGLAPKDRAGS